MLLLSKIVKRKDGWYVISEKTGRNLGGPYKTKEEAVKRLRQVEYFKRKKGDLGMLTYKQLKQKINKILSDKRPPKRWWENCMKRARKFADDPARYCGGLWYGSGDFKYWDKDLLEKMRTSFGKPYKG